MRTILKAEFKYNIAAILIAYTILIISFYIALNGSMENIHGLLVVSFFTFFISVGIIGSESDREKRERFLTLLPIPLKTYSITRLLFVIFYILIWYIINKVVI